MIRQYNDPDCAIARSLEVFGDGWSLMVIRQAFFGARRFADFERLGISKNILTKRLAHLVEQGIFTKSDAGQFGARYEYQLTTKGKDLLTMITAIRQWGDRWIFGEGKEPILVVDRATGEPIRPVRIQRENGEPVPAKDLALTLGPGASDELKTLMKLAEQRKREKPSKDQ